MKKTNTKKGLAALLLSAILGASALSVTANAAVTNPNFPGSSTTTQATCTVTKPDGTVVVITQCEDLVKK